MHLNFSFGAAGSMCAECGEGLGGHSLKCSECAAFVHLACSELPRVCLVRLALTRASYSCSTCIKAKAGDKWPEVLKEIDTILCEEKEKIDKTNSSQESDGEPPASPLAPSAFQVLLSPRPEAAVGSGSCVDWAAPVVEQSTVASGTKMLSASKRRRDPHSLQPVVPGISRGDGAAPAAGHGDNTGRSKKKSFCRYYKSDRCKFRQKGEGCRYEHPKKCIKFLRFRNDAQRGCNYSSCSFFHPPLCRLVESGKICNRQKCRYLHRKTALTVVNKNKTRTNVAAPEGRKVGRASYAEVTTAAASSRSSRGDCEPVPGVFDLNHGQNSDEIRKHKLNFHLYHEQLMRIDRQVRQLLDVRDQRRILGPCACR